MGRKVRAAASNFEAQQKPLGSGSPTPFECGGLVASYTPEEFVRWQHLKRTHNQCLVIG